MVSFHGILAWCSTKCGSSSRLIEHFQPRYPFDIMDAVSVILSISNACPDPEVQGVMADSAVKMVKAGCQYITVLGVDFMSENVRAILYQAGFLEIGGESLRIYKREIQENVLEIVGISPEQVRRHLMNTG
ncbi:unnamed protein product [Camellia sinensis]